MYWGKYLCLKQDTRADGVGVEASEQRAPFEDFRASRWRPLHGEDGDHSERNWLPLPDTPEEKLLLPFQEMLAMGTTDKAEPWNPALAMCILCCHGGNGNSCKSLSCFSIKEGGLVLILPDPDLSVKSKLALNDAFLFAYSNNMEHLSCAIDGWHTKALKGD